MILFEDNSAPHTVPTSKAQVFLVDDHPIIRRGLQLLLRLHPRFTVCGEASSGSVALRQMLELRPELAIIELCLKSGSGLQLIKDLRSQGLKTRILVFTISDDLLYVERAMRAGADGYVSKHESTEEVLQALSTLLEGKRYLPGAMAEQMMNRLVCAPVQRTGLDQLSDRELEVLESIGAGLSSREIAERLMLSFKTVESHRERIKAKLGLERAAELVSVAFDFYGHLLRTAPSSDKKPWAGVPRRATAELLNA